jgi:ABC-type Zn uptake system ZnuABC Zn-binding protein ZnuA
MTTRRLACFLLALTALAAAALPGCGPADEAWHAPPPHVAVTLPALDGFARNVLGDHGQVVCLAAEGGAHRRDAAGRDARLLHGADLLFANGLGLDDAFVEKARVNSANPALEAAGRVVKLGDGLPKGKLYPGDGGEADAHVWLGVSQAQAMVNEIRDKLKEIDPGHAADYDANAKAYNESLDQDVLAYGKDLFKGKSNTKLISSHDALRYFAADFDLDVVAAVAPGPDAAPSAKRCQEIAKLCRDKGVREAVLFAVEPDYPTSAVDAVRNELGRQGVKDVAVVEIDPLEKAKATDLNDRDWYTNKMRENLKKLAEAMEKLPK